MGGYAWVTLATNDSYSLGALVLAHSLKKSNTAHKLAVLITPAVTQPMRNQLESVFDVVKLVDVLDSKDEAHLGLMKRPELGVTFTKIHCWRFTEFDKCVFLDADTLVVRNCDELFEREEFSAAPDVSWPDCFNSGVFVYKPSAETFNKLLRFAMDNGSFDGGDQGLLNQFFSDWATKDIKKHLPFVYNLTSIAVYSYIPAFKHYGSDTRIVHFIGTGKPWLQQLNPATKTITPTPGSEHLTPLLQKWWDIFCEKVHPFMNKNLGAEESKMNLGPTPSAVENAGETSKITMPQSTTRQATVLQPEESAKMPPATESLVSKMSFPDTKDGASVATAQTQPVSSALPNETKMAPAKTVPEELPVSSDAIKKPVVPSAPILSPEFLKLHSANVSQASTPVEKITTEISSLPAAVTSSQNAPMQGQTLKDLPPKNADITASQTKSDNASSASETVSDAKSVKDVSMTESKTSSTPEVSSLVTHFAASEITSATLLPPQVEKKNEVSKNDANQKVAITKTPPTPTEPCVEPKDFAKQVVLEDNKKAEASEPEPSEEITGDAPTDKKGTAVVPYCDVFQTAKDAQATKPHFEKDSLRKTVEETIKKQSEAKTDQFPPIPMPESPTKIQPPTVENTSFSTVKEHSQEEPKKDEPKTKKGVISKILEIVGVGSKDKPEGENETSNSTFYDGDKSKGEEEQKEVSMPTETKTEKQMETAAQNLASAEAQENLTKSKKSKKLEKPESGSPEADKSAKDVANDSSKAKDKKNSKNNKGKGPKPSAPLDKKKDSTQTEANKEVETTSPKDASHPPQTKGNHKEKPKAKGDKKENSGGKKVDKVDKIDKGDKAKPSEQSLPSPQDAKTAAKKKSPSPTLSITQPSAEDANKPEKPKTSKNLAFLTIDDSIPDTPPATESKESGNSAPSVEGKLLKEIDDLIEKAKVVAESQIQSLIHDENQNEGTSSDASEKCLNKSGKPEQNKQKCQSDHPKEKKGEQKQKVHSPAAQPEEFEELKVTSEEDRKKHKSEVVTSKLSDQILKAIPPPRRKAITDHKAGEGSGSAGPKKPEEPAASKLESQKQEGPHAEPPKSSGGGGGGGNQKSKGGADPVPPPRNRSKPRQKTPPKGKPKK